jgi:hypothetical protein
MCIRLLHASNAKVLLASSTGTQPELHVWFRLILVNFNVTYLRGSRYGTAPHHMSVLAAGLAQGSDTGESLSFAPRLLGSLEVLLTSTAGDASTPSVCQPLCPSL